MAPNRLGVQMQPNPTTIARFWSKVDRSGGPDACWPWLSYKNRRGYGRFHFAKHHVPAHRLAYELIHGPLDQHLVCCHRCDNPPCCNPAHLFGGTHRDNIQDAVAKGRWHHRTPPRLRPDQRHWRAQLTETQVREIRRRIAAGEAQKDLAAAFGVHRCCISDLHLGRTYRSVV